ncbi:MAG: hypothetical protein NXH95_12745 [Pseudomonadaceae bacterium]|nr:hypothetical protein [Pseudomonadaceae bacterium]
MHIIIAVITAVAGLLWALNSLQRSGFDLNSLNPFYWARRRAWEQKQINPLYAIETSRELAAVLLFAVMRQAGDPTKEQKEHLLSLYTNELKFTETDSAEMYSVASHLINTDPNYMHKVPDLIAPSLGTMSDDQKTAIPNLLKQVATFSSAPNPTQIDFTQAVDAALNQQKR